MDREFKQRARRGGDAREAALAGVETHAPAGNDAIKALIVNLEGSRERLEKISGHLRDAGVEYERVPGIRGSDLSRYAVRQIAPNWGKAINGDDRLGTLGCFLGHIKAWEKAAAGDGRVHLILEDDAAPRGVLPRSLSALGVSTDWDICFVNTRMEKLFAEGEDLPSKPTLFSALEARLSRPATQKATGGEAYFLSKQGAAKLLEVVDRVGPFTHVDWFIFIVGVSEEEAEGFGENDRARRVYDRFREQLAPTRDIRFRAMALWPALMGPSGGLGLGSTRKAENVAGAKALEDS